MIRALGVIICLLTPFLLMAQVRNGWRSFYDTEGRLVRMSFYKDGEEVIDSTHYYQYHFDGILKGIVRGELSTLKGCENGSVTLFSQDEKLSSYTVHDNNQTVYNFSRDEDGRQNSVWVDRFDAPTRCWVGDSFNIENGELVLVNTKSSASVIYSPSMPVNLNAPFQFTVTIPVKGNSSRQGVILGWKDDSNYLLFELTHGDCYSISEVKNGEFFLKTEPRVEIEKPNEELTVVKFTNNGKNLLIEINNKLEKIMPIPLWAGDKIGLNTRSRGKTHFSEMVFEGVRPMLDPNAGVCCWIGKSTGFFISSDGKILTTYDAVSDTKHLRVKTIVNGEEKIFPVVVYFTEESLNIAVLKIVGSEYKPFDELPFGYLGRKPISDSKVFSIGYPNAVSGILTEPTVYEGHVLPQGSTNQLELSFRYGMIGAPVFDDALNLIGVITGKGTDLSYTEVIDFYAHQRFFQSSLKRTEEELDSPFRSSPMKDKLDTLSKLLVIVEGRTLD
jgi:hypothetical protein